jgi:hypothetical protein
MALAGHRRALSPLMALIGAVVTFFALAVGAVLFVVFAATLALVLLLASLLIGLAALTLSSRRSGLSVKSGAAGVLTLGRPPVHAWIAYQWDRPSA